MNGASMLKRLGTVESPDRTMACGCPTLGAYPRLIALAVGLPLVEAVLLGVVGASDTQAMAPQASAVAPFGVFHDLRWLLVFHSSWLAFALELAAMVAVRSALTALLVRAAWPTTRRPPSWTALVAGSVAFTLASAVVLLPFAALLLGMAVVSLSWLFFIAVPAVLCIAALVHHGAVLPTWWREPPPARTVAWVLLSFLALSLASAVIVLTPAPLNLVAVAAAGLFNGWAWHSVVHTLRCRERAPRFLPVAPLGVVALVAVIVLGVGAGFSVASRDEELAGAVTESAAPEVAASAGDDDRPVLVVSGFGSNYPGHDHGDGPWRDQRRFSYAGLSDSGEPLAYEDVDTYQDVALSVTRMTTQVEAFHDEVDRPITMIAESEGALVAKAYLLAHPEAPVDTLVLLSPLVEPGGAYYPPAGDDGWGVAAGWGLQWISALTRTLSPVDVTSDEGLFRSLADNAPALRGMLACPLDGVDQLAVFPLADAVAGSEPQLDGVRSTVVPAFHGGLADNGDVQGTIRAALDQRTAPEGGWWHTTDTMIRAGAATWRVPTLPLSVNPAWEHEEDVNSCAEIVDSITAWVR
jgi:hypothetical protein